LVYILWKLHLTYLNQCIYLHCSTFVAGDFPTWLLFVVVNRPTLQRLSITIAANMLLLVAAPVTMGRTKVTSQPKLDAAKAAAAKKKKSYTQVQSSSAQVQLSSMAMRFPVTIKMKLGFKCYH